jgi:3-methyladenine DNA glycosylase AlkD
MNASDVVAELRRAASPEKALVLARFFKTGRGEYGEGDLFLGVMVPEQRKIAKSFLAGTEALTCRETLAEVLTLLGSAYHEERLTALLILVGLYNRSGDKDRERIYGFYLKNLKCVNNWDLVDLSAPNIVGAHLLDKDSALLFTLAGSDHLWTRRVAVLASFAFIRAGCFSETLSLAQRLLVDDREAHDLMHKAVGWMLREVGKRDQQVLEAFLDLHAARLPRTALRYAIERFAEPTRAKYLRCGR